MSTEKERDMRRVIGILLISILAFGTFGCFAEATAKAAVIPSRTLLKVILIDGLNSDTSSVGDTFLASLAESVVIGGITVLEKRTMLLGLVSESSKSGTMKEDARIRFTLTSLAQGDQSVPITTNTFTATSTYSGKVDSEIVGGGAGFGFAGTGKEIHYGPETRLNFTLERSVQLQIEN